MSKKIEKTRSPRTYSILFAAIALLLGVLGAWWWFVSSPRRKYEPVVDGVRDHTIAIDQYGHIDLSKQFPGITPKDDMLATKLPDGNFRLMFPTYYGPGLAIAGVMYTSRQLQPADTENRNSAIRYNQLLIRVGNMGALVIDKKLDDHWYEVSYSMR